MARGRRLKNPNGYGSVVKLSGKRRKPYEVRVNTRMDERNYPTYDVLGRFEDRMEALSALVKYHEKPYDLKNRKVSFSELYTLWYKSKYEDSAKKLSKSSKYCTMSAYGKCSDIYDKPYYLLRANDFNNILLQQVDGKNLSHALQEHIKNLFLQMDRYALEHDIIEKSYSAFAKISILNDDEPGVPFTNDELLHLWKNKDVENVDTILILCYSGWRISEALKLTEINLDDWFFRGGNKTAAGKNRIVPIHSAIREMVNRRYQDNHTLFPVVTRQGYAVIFENTLSALGLQRHTPHDCRHTFTSLLDSAGSNPICIDRLIGHASEGITKKVYTHKELTELRDAVELIKIPIY